MAKDYQGAIETYTTIINLDISNIDAYTNRSKLRRKIKDYDGFNADMEILNKLNEINKLYLRLLCKNIFHYT